MGRKSRAKAALRAARERGAIAGPDPMVARDQAPVSPTPAPTAGPWLVSEMSGASTPRSRLASGVLPPTEVGSTPASRPGLPPPDGCAKLRELAAGLLAAQRAVEEEIRTLLDRGHSWTDVGRALGLSRQGARQRYQSRLSAESRSSGESR